MDFPVPEQLITQTKQKQLLEDGATQDKNKELPFYPDPIYRPPPRPPEKTEVMTK